ncbi:ubiquitin carboxyl-terminal hydrolase-domain-containing protein [Lineolata rhizophorae]|uniref:ubiquitinyl hydrolase 1 n=1 Tax=Lineolata rhizophorae TaxID=578093 RepID=A0A6A6NZS3_9PEZI|nr:ubiquitin carboxyl-terminal hydrolase-domain-containing protein [Lineolata rhizophorae]
MNGVSRFLSRREKRSHQRNSSKSRTPVARFPGVFNVDDARNKPEKDEDKLVKTITQRLAALGITSLSDSHIRYALRYSKGDVDKSLDLLVLFEDSTEGILKEYSTNVRMLGAENREKTTCYLDALLFAMFARLDSFEGMLYNNFSDDPRKNLAGMLRLWVNMLRGGKLITTDVTRHLQNALSRCGWSEAAEIMQQDASEAFTFITGKLELPLLTLKMDIYHTGKEDIHDDHKFVNERLLEVAIPSEGNPDGSPVTLEDCLETYFNNRIEVKRHLQLQRRNTTQSIRSMEMGKGQVLHIESVEVGTSRPGSPAPATPTSPRRPGADRRRADSIFSERMVYRTSSDMSEKKAWDDSYLPPSRRRGNSNFSRKEVLMPAWQFFSLIPWYTDNAPTSDAQVAAHFSAKRPVLGICLKRYMMNPNGTPKRLDTYVDIPLEIGLPHFISDDKMEDDGPLFGNFKLSLQSVVCHRGVSVDSGHYVALVRGDEDLSGAKTPSTVSLETPDQQQHRPSSAGSNTNNNASSTHLEDPSPPKWFLFDDLAKERVRMVDITKALHDESPYLLFYQVQPIDDDTLGDTRDRHHHSGGPGTGTGSDTSENLPAYSETDPELAGSEEPPSEVPTEPATAHPSTTHLAPMSTHSSASAAAAAAAAPQHTVGASSNSDAVDWSRSNSVDLAHAVSRSTASSLRRGSVTLDDAAATASPSVAAAGNTPAGLSPRHAGSVPQLDLHSQSHGALAQALGALRSGSVSASAVAGVGAHKAHTAPSTPAAVDESAGGRGGFLLSAAAGSRRGSRSRPKSQVVGSAARSRQGSPVKEERPGSSGGGGGGRAEEGKVSVGKGSLDSGGGGGTGSGMSASRLSFNMSRLAVKMSREGLLGSGGEEAWSGATGQGPGDEKAGRVARSKSKRDKEKGGHKRSSSRLRLGADQLQGMGRRKNRKGERPERECVVM